MTVTIDPEDARDLIESDEAVIVDVRRPEEREESRIPGSLHVPWDRFDEGMEEIPTEGTVIFHCHRGGRGARARKAFDEATDAEALNLRGGLVAWAERGFPVEDAPP